MIHYRVIIHIFVLLHPVCEGLAPDLSLPPDATLEHILDHGPYKLSGTGCAGKTFTKDVTLSEEVW